MKFLVLWSLEQSLLSDAMVRAIARMPEYGQRLEEQGSVLMRYHVVGAHGSTTWRRTRSSSDSSRWPRSSTSPATPSTPWPT